MLTRRGGQGASFYDTLAGLGTAVGEAEAQELFLDTLPNAWLGLSTREINTMREKGII